MNKTIALFLGLFLELCLVPKVGAQESTDIGRIMANPLNLSYRFYTDGVSHRTAADPVIEYFKDKYYLFGSHCGGYFVSPDLKTWTYIRSTNLPAVNAWAPAVMVYEDAVYYMGMGEEKIYKSTNPEADQWEEIDSKCGMSFGDPSFFKDDDGRVYIIWGCSANGPIQGVEVDPKDGFKRIGTTVDLLPHNMKKYGWEVPGDNNELTDKDSWNEGPCLIKVNGLYYLQYATPGTEYTSYSTGVYVSENPLGPYTCSVSNPFATKPGGFMRGAGHGHTFRDKYGNYWFVGSMILSVREHFERRLGIFPVYFGSDGYMRAHTVFSDFPFILPDKKVDFETTDISAGMNILSYRKAVKASSFKTGYEPDKAADENIRTWWAAATGNAEEWLEMDLGDRVNVSAIQMNLADEAFQIFRNDEVPLYKYMVETSLDGITWETAIDRSENRNDYVHELITFDQSIRARYIRVTNKAKLEGCFSIYDLRIFGVADGEVPAKVKNFICTRGEDSRRIHFAWEQQADVNTRYVIRWGTDPVRIDNATIVEGGSADIGLFSVENDYYCTIQAMNEAGAGEKSEPFFVKAADAVPSISLFDQTDRAVKLGSSVSGLDITPMIDNDAKTILVTPFQKEMYFDVNLSDRTKITGYALTAGDASGSPRSWKLQALAGKNWRTIDEQRHVKFRAGDTKTFLIPYASYSSILSSTGYRLLITENNGGEDISMMEWQLFGSPVIFESSICNNGGEITDQYNTNNHEGVKNLIDKSASTKYCAVDKGNTFWMQYVSPTPVNIKRYSLVSANDAPERDPVDWTLEASNDGLSWTVLDRRTDQDFITRFNALEYLLDGAEKRAFTHFRLNVSKITDGRTFQLSEWQLFDTLSGTGIQNMNLPGVAVMTHENMLTITSDADETGTYEIFSITGQTVSKGKVEKGVEVSETYTSGAYLVVIETSSGRLAKKVTLY